MFLTCTFFAFNVPGVQKSDESDEEESDKFGSGLESGSFGTFSTGLGGLLSRVDF